MSRRAVEATIRQLHADAAAGDQRAKLILEFHADRERIIHEICQMYRKLDEYCTRPTVTGTDEEINEHLSIGQYACWLMADELNMIAKKAGRMGERAEVRYLDQKERLERAQKGQALRRAVQKATM